MNKVFGIKIEKLVILSILLNLSTLSLAKTFATNDPKMDAEIKKLELPLHFGIPKSATSKAYVDDEYVLPAEANPADEDQLYWYKHPDTVNEQNPVGLRFYFGKRNKKLAANLAKSKFVKSGDVIVSFRPDWSVSGPYTSAQMGQTHAGLVYIDDDNLLKNIEHPLEPKFLLPDRNPIGDDGLSYLESDSLSDENVYKKQPMVHIFRPRVMKDDPNRVKNFNKWAKLLRAQTSASQEVRDNPRLSIFPRLIGFNIDYMDPKFNRGDTAFDWVKQMGQLILKKENTARLDMYCSELVYTFLALTGCDPDNNDHKQQILGNGPATCIKPVFNPLKMIGNLFVNEEADPNLREPGLSDGPVLVIDSQKYPVAADRQAALNKIFNPATGQGNLSRGQQSIVKQVTPSFVQLKDYYAGMYDNTPLAQVLRSKFNTQKGEPASGLLQPDPNDRNPNAAPTVPIYYNDNYSPTSFGINSYLPEGNASRAMDYVGTIAFMDQLRPPPQR